MPPSLTPRFAAMFTSQNVRTRTTAPVVKHVCLFTRDLRRKHKRWQDGRLEFHTFNRRVMVYDDNGTFIGDSHRIKHGDVEDGNEFQLDRGNIIVQVAELISQRDQDITEIVTRKAKSQKPLTQSPESLPTPRMKPSSSHSQLRHLPLQSLLSTPGRQIGRAVVPTTSPYEQRKQTPEDAERLPKRRRIETNRVESDATPTVPPRAVPSLPQQPTTPAPQVSCNPPRRNAFSSQRMQKLDHAPTTTHESTAPGGPAVGIPNLAHPDRIDLTYTSPSSQKPLPRADYAQHAQFNQTITTSSRRANNSPIHSSLTGKRNLVPGKENQETVRSKRGEEPATASSVPLNAVHAGMLDELKQPCEPTTALRLGSAQRRGLLVARSTHSWPQQRGRIPAQHVGRRIHVSPEAVANADSSPEITQMGGTEQREPAQLEEERIQINPKLMADTGSQSGITLIRDTGQREPDSASEPISKPRQQDITAEQRADNRIQVSHETTTDADASPEIIPMNDMRQRGPDPPLPADVPASESGKSAVTVVMPSTRTRAGGGAWSREADDLLDYKRVRRDGESAK